jgi:hypothetical protein
VAQPKAAIAEISLERALLPSRLAFCLRAGVASKIFCDESALTV